MQDANYVTNLSAIYGQKNPHIYGRDEEIFKMILTLSRHEKPNIILKGEPGVGKTALAHKLAYLIGQDMVPDHLKEFQIIEINCNALLAGPGYRGVTEEKFQKVIDAAITKKKVILFFDEFHVVEKLGEMANGQTPGLGNTLKPYLTKGHFRVIGATTNEEFKKITDGALLRRFTKIDVPEPNKEACLKIATNLLNAYAGDMIKYGKKDIDAIVNDFYALSTSVAGSNPDKLKDICDVFSALCKIKDVKKPSMGFVAEFVENYAAGSFCEKTENNTALV